MTVLGEAVVRVVPETRGFEADLENQVEKPVASTAGRIATLLGGAFALSKAKDFFVDTINAASDLNEETSKTETVFGEASASVLAFADDAADSLGQSRQQALGAAGTFGNLLRSLELSEAKAAEMSTTMVALASDLASFNNADPTEVLDALRAGLVGEAEPLKRYGININAARIETEAMALGLGDASGELTQAAKAQATYSLILKDSTLAQGDFARTSDGLANTQRTLTARWNDAKTEIGQGLLPLALELAGVASDELLPAFTDLATAAVPLIIQAFEIANPLMGSSLTILTALAPVLTTVARVIDSIPDPIIQLATLSVVANRGIGGIVNTTSRLTERLAGLATVDWSGNITGPSKGAASALSGVNVAALGVTAAVAAGVFAYDQATQASREYDGQVKELARSLQEVVGGQSDVNDVVREFLESEFEDFGPKSVEALNAFGLSFQDLEDAIVSGADVLDPFRDKVRDLGVDLRGIDFGQLDSSAGASSGALQELADELGVSAGALRDLIDQVEDYDNATQDAAQAELDRLVASGELTQADRDAYVQQTLLQDGSENYAAALQQVKIVLGLMTDATGDATDASGPLAGAIEDTTDEVVSQVDAISDLNDEMSDLIDNLLDAYGSQLDYEEAVAGTEGSLRDLVDAEKNLAKTRGPDGARALRQAELELADARENLTELQRDGEASALDLVNAEQQIRDAELAVAEAKGSHTEASRELGEALRDVERDAIRQAEAAVEVAEKNAEADGRTLSWTERNQILRAELEKVRTDIAPGSPLDQSLSGLIANLDAIPGDYAATVTLRLKDNGVLEALDYINSVGGGIDVPAGLVTGSTNVFGGAARGFYGTVGGGGTPLVIGEGPREDVLVVPQSLGGLDRVIADLAGAVAAGSGTPMLGQMIVQPAPGADAYSIAQEAVRQLRGLQYRVEGDE